MLNQERWNIHVIDAQPESDWTEQDAKFGLPTDDQIVRHARMIDHMHSQQGDRTKNWRGPEHRMTGLFGERAFCRVFGCKMDLRVKRYGSLRRNTKIRGGRYVDVVTRTMLRGGNMPDLTVREGGNGQKAELVVMVLWIGRGWEPVFLGWIEHNTIMQQGEQAHYMTGITNRVMPIALLNPMWELMEMHRPKSRLAIHPDLLPPEPVRTETLPDGPQVSQERQLSLMP